MSLDIEVRSSGPGPRERLWTTTRYIQAAPTEAIVWRFRKDLLGLWPRAGVAVIIRRVE